MAIQGTYPTATSESRYHGASKPRSKRVENESVRMSGPVKPIARRVKRTIG